MSSTEVTFENTLPKCDIDFTAMDAEYAKILSNFGRNQYHADIYGKLYILFNETLNELDIFVSNIISNYDLNKLLDILVYKNINNISTLLFQELQYYNYLLKQSAFGYDVKLLIIIDSINCIDDLIKYVNNNDFNKIIIKTLLCIYYFNPYNTQPYETYNISITKNKQQIIEDRYSLIFRIDRSSNFDKLEYLIRFKYNHYNIKTYPCRCPNRAFYEVYFKNLYDYDYILNIPSNIKIKELENTIDQLKYQVDLQNQTITIMQHQLKQLLKK